MRWLKNYGQHLNENIGQNISSFWTNELKKIAENLTLANMVEFFEKAPDKLPKQIYDALKSEGWEYTYDGTVNFWANYCHTATEDDDFGDGPFIKIVVEIDPPKDTISAYGEFWIDPGYFMPYLKIDLNASSIEGVNFDLGDPTKYLKMTPVLMSSVAKNALQELRTEFAKIERIKLVNLMKETSLNSKGKNWIFEQLYNGDMSLFPGREKGFNDLFGDLGEKLKRVQKTRSLFKR